MSFPGLTIIGERINPGFRSTEALFDNEDIPGIQQLAKRQAEEGATYLNVNCGTKALENPDFMVSVIEAIQETVNIPLSIDCPDFEVQKRCLQAYDPDKAGGEKPIINSIAETRWEMTELLSIRPCKVMLMASERMDEERKVPNKKGEEVYVVARRMVDNLKRDYGLVNDDFIIDVSISAIAADFEGLIRMALEGTRLINSDPDLAGVHVSGGLSNLPQQMPALGADGEPLALRLENAFLTLAHPLGFDYVLGTPWRNYQPLPTNDFILCVFKDFVEADGMTAMQIVQKFYRAA